MSSRTLIASLLFVLSISGVANTQQNVEPAGETGLVLEVTYLKSMSPAYQRVRRSGSGLYGSWYGRFGRIAGWKLPQSTLPIRAVRILPYLTGETVTIKVWVLRGQKYMETEETVGTYSLREHEKLSVDALKNFGVEPFDIKVVRLAPLPSNLPGIENKTVSVEVIGIEPVVSTLPVYKLKFRNLSTKSIEAIHLRLMQNKRSLGHGMPQGLEGNPLMAPNETVEWRVPLVTRADGVAGNYLPSVLLDQRMVITGVVFSDGTTEGAEPRTNLQAVKRGRKIELDRILPLLENALTEPESNSTYGPAKLKSQLESLKQLNKNELSDLTKTFIVTADISSSVEFGMHLMRREVLDHLGQIPANASAHQFRSWLVEAKEKYSNWRTRLDEPGLAN